MFSQVIDRVRDVLGMAPRMRANPDPDGLTIDEAWDVYRLAVGHEAPGGSVVIEGRRDTGFAVVIRRPAWKRPLLILNSADWHNYARRVDLERHTRARAQAAQAAQQPMTRADGYLSTLAQMSRPAFGSVPTGYPSQPSYPSHSSQPSGASSFPRARPVPSMPPSMPVMPTAPAPQSQMLRTGGSEATDPGAMLRVAPVGAPDDPPTELLPVTPLAPPAPPTDTPAKASKPRTPRAASKPKAKTAPTEQAS